MPGLQPPDENKDEKLKAALWYAIGQTVDSIALAQDLNATPHFIGALSEMVWAQIDTVAQDLESFAQHAGRATITSKDVVLLGRRNDDLAEVLRTRAEEVKGREAAL